MTGFGSASTCQNNLEINIEISSVNRKNLEISPSIPREWQNIERNIHALAREHFQRGKINITLRLSDTSTTGGLTWNETAINAILEKINSIGKKYQGSQEVTPELILNIAKTISISSHLPDSAPFVKAIESALNTAFNQVNQMRINEGKALTLDLKTRLQKLSTHLAAIEEYSKKAVPAQRDALLQRLEQANLAIDLNDERVLKELALFADRSDISEETTRLYSHFDQFNATLKCNDDTPVGRKMDFICQEIHRELNTIGSKTSLIEVTQHIIDSKNELERIREQVQNVE